MPPFEPVQWPLKPRRRHSTRFVPYRKERYHTSAHSTSFEVTVDRSDLVLVGKPHRRVTLAIKDRQDPDEVIQAAAAASGKDYLIVAFGEEDCERNLGIRIVFVLIEGTHPLGGEPIEQALIAQGVHVTDHDVGLDAGCKGPLQA